MNLVSTFDIFKIGVGPSSSHTVGPMLAALHFVDSVLAVEITLVGKIKVELFGSLSLTGKGHGTDLAIVCGLEGFHPQDVDCQYFADSLRRIAASGQINLRGQTQIAASVGELIHFNSERLPLHPNGMTVTAVSKDGKKEWSKTYYSIGGGFINDEKGVALVSSKQFIYTSLPHKFNSAAELLQICESHSMTIEQVMQANEVSIRSFEQIKSDSQKIWQVMKDCIQNGCKNTGTLPGGLNVKRRAAEMYSKLGNSVGASVLSQLDFLSCYALAVNEENASFGRVVTAPTNGAAGIIPAVFNFYLRHLGGTDDKFLEYLLVAAAIANLFKSGASLSAAEMGCQGEIGVAASMAAAGLTSLQGGTAMQIENAAEIAIEHSLGLTCDPIAGLVQIPCIERNAIGAMKAVTASQLALKSDGKHIVSLDQAIAAMKKTGHDMHAKYKETSTGGLAISVAAPEC